jgi:hypothetical protein
MVSSSVAIKAARLFSAVALSANASAVPPALGVHHLDTDQSTLVITTW